MTDAWTLLRSQCQVLLEMTEAGSVTVYLRAPHDLTPAIWLHHGALRPVRELENAEAARAFDDEMRARFPLQPGQEAFPSKSGRGHLHAVSARAKDAHWCSIDRRSKTVRPANDLVWVAIGFGERHSSADALLEIRRPPGFLEALQLLAALTRHARELSELLEDPVTDLPSRFVEKVELTRRLQRARDGEAMVLILVSPEELDEVRDRLGREVADELLAEMARRMRSVVRAEDFVSRHSGATLACLMTVEGREGAGRAAAKVLARLAADRYGKDDVALTFCAGGVVSEGSGGTPFEWLQRADAALAESRRRGDGHICLLSLDSRPERRAVHGVALVHKSRQIDDVLSIARRVAASDATVLIVGESGSGKELIARAIHDMSPRRSQRFVIVDCGAISPTLVESELFGHERGAFTGAEQKKAGRLVEAEGGTVLLDEIGELPLDVQAKLLRFVQEKQVTPVGSNRPQSVDVRILAATNADLVEAARQGRFRADLYHRLNVVPLKVPPLRDRPDDILPLAQHFVREFAATHGARACRLSAEAEALLHGFAWPGNVRQLQNCILRAVLLAEGSELTIDDFPDLHEPAAAPARHAEPDPIAALVAAVARQVEGAAKRGAHAPPVGRWTLDDLVLEAHASAEGIVRKAAALVGVPETTFRRRIGRVQRQAAAGLPPRPERWEEVREAVRRLAGCGAPPGVNLLDLVEGVVLEEVAKRCPGDTRTGAALVGITEATLRLRLQGSASGSLASIGADHHDS